MVEAHHSNGDKLALIRMTTNFVHFVLKYVSTTHIGGRRNITRSVSTKIAGNN